MSLTPYYQDEQTTLYQGDSLQVLAELAELQPGTVDAVITDPPYSSGGMFRGDRVQSTSQKYFNINSGSTHRLAEFAGDNKDQRSFMLWMQHWLSDTASLTVPGGIIGVFTDWRQLPAMTDCLQFAGLIWRGILPWSKPNGRRVQGRLSNTAEYFAWATNGARALEAGNTLAGHWVESTPSAKKRLHQTEKPLELMEYLVGVTHPGSLILDPFAGSGSTLVAAKRSGRRAIGVELSEHYAQVIAERLEATPPPLESDGDNTSAMEGMLL